MYNARDARDAWKSFKAGGGITIASLFRMAKAHGWRDDGKYQKPTPAELAERQRQAAVRAANEAAGLKRQRDLAKLNAQKIRLAATLATSDNPYLQRKKILPTNTLWEIDISLVAAILGYAPKSHGERLTGRVLVVVIKVGLEISNLELIDGAGRKAALAGGAKAGGYWASDRLPNGPGEGLTLLIGEGVATVLSAKQASGHPAIATLSSGNLLAVARTMRDRYPAAVLIILADLVKLTGEPDPHAIEAARAVGGRLAVPDFGPNRPTEQKDFNDLLVRFGADAVKRSLEAACHVE